MLRLHLIQAEFGDSLLLEAGTTDERTYILIDGGPGDTFEDHLRSKLDDIAGDDLRLVVLSHVDRDHVTGLLDLVAELRRQAADGESELVRIAELWHNSFGDTIGQGTDIQARLQALSAVSAAVRQAEGPIGNAVNGIAEGNQLRVQALAHGIPLNAVTGGDPISPDGLPAPVGVGPVQLRIVGPTPANLEALRGEWIEWLEEFEGEVDDPVVAAMADGSIPNLSSITFVAEAEGRRILFTGDARGDHLLEGLGAAGLLDAEGRIHVDLLKLPHHGSDRNVNRTFFLDVTADIYAISANGLHDNPDMATLIWIVEAAREQDREIEIVCTNRTDSTRKLLDDYDPDEYGYEMRFLSSGAHSTVVELA